MNWFDTFIPQNTAVKGARRIGIYNKKGNRVGFIPLGSLAMPKGEKLYSFGALSDVHYQYETGADDFHNALTYLNNTEDVAFTCICGDLTSNGTDTELNEYKSAVDTHSPDTPVYAITGNHDTYQGLHDSIQTYTAKPLYYSFTHGDDVFIMVGIVGEAESDLFRTEILQWLYETLEANRNKRCFLFQHIPTVEGSGDGANLYPYVKLRNETNSIVFKSLLSHYPNVIFFHGHTHMRYRLQEYGDNANYDNYFGCHSVHIPALAVPRDANASGTGYEAYIAGSEGYVVDVYENAIHLRGRDFVKGEFLPIASYWLDTTLQNVEAGTYTDSTGTIDTGSLPAGYTLLDYIESDGNQYIVTDYFPSNKSRVVADLQFTAVGLQSRVFSALTDAYAFDFYINGNKKLAFNAGTSRTNTATTVSANTSRHIYEIDCHTARLDGTALKTLTASAGQCSHSLVLLARRTSGGETITYLDSPTKARLYSLKIYANGTLVRNYLPCINPDGEVGLYDLVTKTFCGNSGEGAFLADGYKLVEYIESDGNQYIDTEFVPNTNSKMWLDFYPTVKQSKIFAGCRVTNKDRAFTINSGGSANTDQFATFGTTGNTVIGAHSVGRHTASIENGLFTYDGVETSVKDSTLNATYSVYLFACNTNGATLQATCRIYGCKLWDNGTLARDFIPCINADGEAGMYDKISKQFYGNDGEGEFTVGEDV